MTDQQYERALYHHTFNPDKGVPCVDGPREGEFIKTGKKHHADYPMSYAFHVRKHMTYLSVPQSRSDFGEVHYHLCFEYIRGRYGPVVVTFYKWAP